MIALDHTDFRSLYDLAPVALFVEDYQQLNAHFAELRARGVVDLREYLLADSERVAHCVRCIDLLSVNQKSLSLFRASSIEVIKSNFSTILGEGSSRSFIVELEALWRGELGFSNQTVNYSLEGDRLDVMVHGRVMPGHEHDWSRVMVAVDDITARVRAEKLLDHLATHDSLTGLRNRAYFSQQAELIAREGPHPIAVCAIDLNGLKHVNDSRGHSEGDTLLRRAGAVLKLAAGEEGIAVRLGGDEFLLLVPGVSEKSLGELEARIQTLVAADNAQHCDLALSFAVGGVVCEAGESVLAAEKRADELMFEAKRLHYSQFDRAARLANR
jgi:diguanylate cyclase (GGDEF)-like protein